MIGYYVHHVGNGQVHRARAIAAEMSVPIVGVSSLPRPDGWHGDWVQLVEDMGGTRDRMSALSTWLEHAGPRLVVADDSAEVAVVTRLQGVQAVSILLPGRRTDESHLLGFGVSSALIAAWPASASLMLPGLPGRLAGRVHHVGAISRFPVSGPPAQRRSGPPRVTVLLGAGSEAPAAPALDGARAATPRWEWTVLGHDPQDPCADAFAAIQDADVVVCRAGQDTIAAVAAARRPAVVVPAERAHDEQWTMARALDAGRWPARIEGDFPTHGWAARLEATRQLGGAGWDTWCDGHGAARAAEILTRLHMRRTARIPA